MGSITTNIENSLEIYPNPASSKFNTKIIVNKTVKDASMAIFDINGKQIYNWTGNVSLGEFTKEFDTETLNNGIYIINLNLGREKFSKKLVISK